MSAATGSRTGARAARRRLERVESVVAPAGRAAYEAAASIMAERRRALRRLGLGAAAVYVAPTILHLDRSAQAIQPSCNSKGGKGNPWCNKGGKSKGGKSKGKGNSIVMVINNRHSKKAATVALTDTVTNTIATAGATQLTWPLWRLQQG